MNQPQEAVINPGDKIIHIKMNLRLFVSKEAVPENLLDCPLGTFINDFADLNESDMECSFRVEELTPTVMQ